MQSGLTVLAQNTWAWEEGPHRWARTGSHWTLRWGKDLVLSLKEKPLKAALQTIVLSINTHLRNLYFSDVYRVKENICTSFAG